jgi:hypothetical protein
MKKLTLMLVAVVAMLAASAPAQSLAGSVIVTPKGDALPVATTKLFTFEKAFGRYDLELTAFAGLNASSERGALGFALLVPYAFARNATAVIGPAMRWEAGRAQSVGLVVGLRF